MPKYPIQLKNPPIVESIVEIRFNSIFPDEVVFGIFYGAIKDRYNKIEELNTAKIPKEIIENEPTLKFAPHYLIEAVDKPLLLMIGPKVLVFKYQKHYKTTIEYPGWNHFIYKEIMETLSEITKHNYIKEVLRVGLRTIDFVGDDIFKNLNISINMVNKELDGLEKTIRFNIKEDEFDNIIAISNSSLLMIGNNPNKGSTIDIDTSKEGIITEDIESYLSEILSSGHETNKNLFFELLTEEYKKELEKK